MDLKEEGRLISAGRAESWFRPTRGSEDIGIWKGLDSSRTARKDESLVFAEENAKLDEFPVVGWKDVGRGFRAPGNLAVLADFAMTEGLLSCGGGETTMLFLLSFLVAEVSEIGGMLVFSGISSDFKTSSL